MPRYPFAASLAVALLIVSSCGGSDQASTTPTSTDTDMTSTTAATPTTAPYRSEVYADPTRWLCRPDRTDDFCDVDLSATVIAADGSTSIEPFEPADNAPIDCFYLYPTISDDPGINSDLDANQSEGSTARVQAGRFASVCRIFAPVYRSITLAGLFGGQATPEAREVAFADVVDAWKHYLANDNDGRGVVLIGHSQGASSLRRLASEVIEPDDAQRDLLVSALFLGSAVRIPDATATVGGDFAKIPVCTSSDETGCIVTYATFDAASPPPENTRFGKPRDGGHCCGLLLVEVGRGLGPDQLDEAAHGDVDVVDVETPAGIRDVVVAVGADVVAGREGHLEPTHAVGLAALGVDPRLELHERCGDLGLDAQPRYHRSGQVVRGELGRAAPKGCRVGTRSDTVTVAWLAEAGVLWWRRRRVERGVGHDAARFVR